MSLPDDLCLHLEELIAKAQEGPLIATVAKVLGVLEAANLAFRAKVHSKYIACHPANRDGVGCVGSDCHSLLDDILAVGWDPSAPKPVCVEVRDAHDEVVAFNEKMIQSNNNLLAPLQTGCVKYASLSASHTNQVLRLLRAQHPHTHSAGSEGTAITVGGLLSMEQLRNTDALFHAAAAGGIEWQVVAEKVLQRFPALGELLQEAGNTSGQLQRSETEMQLARRILREVSAAPAGQAVSYQSIRQRVLRSKPACAQAVPWIFGFVVKFAGGRDGSVLLETELAIKMCGSTAQRELGAMFWDNLSRELKGAAPVLRLRHAVLRLAIIGPEKMVAASDVRKLSSTGMKEQVLKADELLMEVRTLVQNHMTDDNRQELLKDLFDFELEVAAIVLEKKHKEHKICGSVEEAAQMLVDRVAEHTDVVISTKWEGHRAEPIASSATASSSGGAGFVATHGYAKSGLGCS